MSIRESDKWKTAVKTRYGYFEDQVMPFSLTNALVTFENYINKILAENFTVFIIVYFNDILIYTKSKRKKHIKTI